MESRSLNPETATQNFLWFKIEMKIAIQGNEIICTELGVVVYHQQGKEGRGAVSQAEIYGVRRDEIMKTKSITYKSSNDGSKRSTLTSSHSLTSHKKMNITTPLT